MTLRVIRCDAGDDCKADDRRHGSNDDRTNDHETYGRIFNHNGQNEDDNYNPKSDNDIRGDSVYDDNICDCNMKQ